MALVPHLSTIVTEPPRSGDAQSARSRDRYRRALMSTGAALGARGIRVLTAVAVVPLTLGYLGPERFGLWTTVTSLAALLVFADLGLGNGLLTAVAKAHGEQDDAALARTVASGIWMLAGVAAAFAAVVAAVALAVDWASVFNLRGAVARSEAGPAILVLGLCYAASLPLSAVTQIRNGLQEGYVNWAFTAGGNVLAIVLVLFTIQMRAGLPYVVLAFMGAPLVAGTANAAALLIRRPALVPRWDRTRRFVALSLLRSGGQFLVLQAAMAAAFYSDTLIATSVIGPTAAAEYGVANTLFLIPIGLVAAGLAPLWPAYGESMARGDTAWIRVTLRRSLALSTLFTVPSAFALVLLARPIVHAWIGGEVEPPGLLIAGFGIWTVLSGIGTSLAVLLNGLHLLRVQAVTAVLMAVLNVTLSILLTQRIGVAGVIFGTVIAYSAATLVPLLLYLPRVLAGLDRPVSTAHETPSTERGVGDS